MSNTFLHLNIFKSFLFPRKILSFMTSFQTDMIDLAWLPPWCIILFCTEFDEVQRGLGLRSFTGFITPFQSLWDSPHPCPRLPVSPPRAVSQNFRSFVNEIMCSVKKNVVSLQTQRGKIPFTQTRLRTVVLSGRHQRYTSFSH